MGHSQLIILDGGMGTTLESKLGSCISQSALWSTQAVVDNPSAIIDVHNTYIRAGARMIETATYQAALHNLVAAGQTTLAAQQTILRAVELAQQAKVAFSQSSADSADKVSVVLSLGPFGATLRPTQEFLGYYPLPYGPKAYSDTEPNTRVFSHVEEEQSAIDSLAQFHFDRLLIYLSDPATWDSINYLAFETVLLPREVKGIRKAMSLFVDHLSRTGQIMSKPWWISFVCPDPESTTTAATTSSQNPGETPENKNPACAGDIESLAQAALASDALQQWGDIPSGIGINCTSLHRLPSLINRLSNVISNIELPPSFKPFLVLYPNGGEYDTINQCWAPRKDGDDSRWASRFADLLHPLVRDGNWEFVVAGGCCYTDPTYIEKLHQATRRLS